MLHENTNSQMLKKDDNWTNVAKQKPLYTKTKKTEKSLKEEKVAWLRQRHTT